MSAGTVVAVKPASEGKGYAKVELPDGTTLEAWTPDFAKAEALNGKPIPDGWSLRDNKQGTGKVLLPPREGGGGGYRGSKEAFDREAASRAAWQLEEEDRKDRRTALMTAFENADAVPTAEEFRPGVEELLRRASKMYEWLKTSGAEAGGVRGHPTAAQDPAPGPSSPAAGPPKSREAITDGVATTEQAQAAAAAQPAPQAGGTTSESGRATAPGETPEPAPRRASGSDTSEPGEAQPFSHSPGSTQDAPGPPHYPLSPAECDHTGRSGRRLSPRKSPRGPVCPRCGLSYIAVTEGTEKDLGAA